MGKKIFVLGITCLFLALMFVGLGSAYYSYDNYNDRYYGNDYFNSYSYLGSKDYGYSSYVGYGNYNMGYGGFERSITYTSGVRNRPNFYDGRYGGYRSYGYEPWYGNYLRPSYNTYYVQDYPRVNRYYW